MRTNATVTAVYFGFYKRRSFSLVYKQSIAIALRHDAKDGDDGESAESKLRELFCHILACYGRTGPHAVLWVRTILLSSLRAWNFPFWCWPLMELFVKHGGVRDENDVRVLYKDETKLERMRRHKHWSVILQRTRKGGWGVVQSVGDEIESQELQEND